jgi:hypothetical protein
MSLARCHRIGNNGGLKLKRGVPPNSFFLKTIFLLTFVSSLFFPFDTFPSHAWCHESPEPDQNQSLKGNKDTLTGIEFLYNERFDDAEQLFHKVIVDSPGMPIGYFYLAMVTWSRLAAGFWSPTTVREYKDRINRTIEVARRRIASGAEDYYDFFYLGGALGFKGRFELMEGNWFSSFSLAVKAVEALKTSLKMNPNNRDVF